MSQHGGAARDRSWVVVAVAVCVAVVGVSTGVAALVLRGGRSVPGTGSVGSVTLVPAATPGADPFTPSVARAVGIALKAAVIAEGAAVRKSLPSDAKTHTRVATGTAPGLYGGSGDVHLCDPRQLVAFLTAHPEKAAAWARVLAIASSDIASYVATLTPVVLTGDTVVGNHGYRDGAPTSLLSVLQAGTAVLVDATGTPRVKCNCGNPLTAPELITLSTAHTRGVPWPGYDPARVTAVRAGHATGTLRMVNIVTGAIYDQPVPAPARSGKATASPSSAALDLHAVAWINITVPGKACMSTREITLHDGVASIPTNVSGGSYQLKLTIRPQYGQLGNGGPRVAAFGMTCFGLGSLGGSHPVKLLSIAVFEASQGRPKLLRLITNFDFGSVTGDPSAYGALVPDQIRIQDAKIVVTGAYLRGRDPACCPSGRATSTISYVNGGLIWTAPAPKTTPGASTSPLRTVTVTTPSGRRYRVSVLAQDTVADCAANAYGNAIISFLKQHPCAHGATRLLFTVPVGGGTVAVSVIIVEFAGTPTDPYIYATQFAQLENASGTGSINDLLRAGTRLPGWPTSIPSAEAFDVTGQDNGLWIFDAWYLTGPTTAQAPELINLENQLFLQPITGH